MAVKQMVPLIEEDELAQYVGLPNQVFPSDHLALVVDLQFKFWYRIILLLGLN